MLRNYRREVLLARRLTSEGIAVQRFHYRGAGHSDGDSRDVTFTSMVDDTLAAADRLSDVTGVKNVAFVGARWGGLVAAAAASTRGAPVAMWEPPVDRDRYFDEILRFRLMHELKRDPGSAVDSEQLLAQLNAAGSVDILGHNLERSLFESARGVALSDIVRPNVPDALLVQVAVGRTLRREYAAVVKAWKERGVAVETTVVPDREAWWLSGDTWPIHETHAPTAKLTETTSGWILRVSSEAGSSDVVA